MSEVTEAPKKPTLQPLTAPAANAPPVDVAELRSGLTRSMELQASTMEEQKAQRQRELAEAEERRERERELRAENVSQAVDNVTAWIGSFAVAGLVCGAAGALFAVSQNEADRRHERKRQAKQEKRNEDTP